MKLYKLEDLEHHCRIIYSVIRVKYTSLAHSENNYDGDAKIISANDICCIATNKRSQMFTIYIDECKNGVAVNKGEDSLTEFYQYKRKKADPVVTKKSFVSSGDFKSRKSKKKGK